MDNADPKPRIRELTRDGDAYRFMMSEPDEGVYIFGRVIEDCNEAGRRLYGVPREALVGHGFLEFAPEMQPNGVSSEVIGVERFTKALAGHTQWFRWHYRKSDGSVSEAMVHVEAILLDGKRRLMIRSRDLLELERIAEHAVAETETRFQQILDHTPAIAYVKDPAGRYVFINREFERLASVPREQILGQSDEVMHPAEIAEELRRNDRRVLEQRQPIEFEETVSLGGGRRTYLSIKFPILDRSGAAVAVGGLSTDITARKRADDALRSAAIAVSTAEGEKIFEELVRSMATALGVDVAFIAVHDEADPETMHTLAMYADGALVPNTTYPIAGTPCAEVCGRDFLLIESGVYQRFPGDPMLPGMRVTGYAGYPLVDPSGRSLGLITIMSRQPLRDAALIESMTKIYAVRAAAEIDRQRTAEGMRQAQRMEAIGHLTGGIAHDFNNILASVMGNIVLAADREAATADARLSRYLDQAMLASKKARDLIGQMLTYSRGRRGEPRPLALGSVLRHSSQLLRSSLPATVDFTTEIRDDVPPALLDRVQMEQVIFNLCINARDAMRASGSIRSGVINSGRIRATCASCRQAFSGEFIELFVADTGPGIEPAVLERMFEPFYTTKEVGKGSGMGLSMVHGIVHEHGGHMLVETAFGQGARFRILVPPLGGTAMPDATMPGVPVRRLQRTQLTGRILLVEDEPSVTEVMRDLLEGWGLTVTAARDGRGALALFVADPDEFDLILTDQTMPRMTGLELARAATRARPGMPVILCTGFGGDVPKAKAEEAGILARLAKPVEPAVLLQALMSHLPPGK